MSQNILDGIDIAKFFAWLKSTGQDDLWEALIETDTDYAGDQGKRLDAGDMMNRIVYRFKNPRQINWSSDNLWFIKFANHMIANPQVLTKRGMTYETDSINWVINMFELWARNQNTAVIPDEIMQEFMEPCTNNEGCMLRHRDDCPVCSGIKNEAVDISKHEYHIMVTTEGPHGTDWPTYRRNSKEDWETHGKCAMGNVPW